MATLGIGEGLRDRLWGVYTMCFGGGIALAGGIPIVFGLMLGALIATLLYPFEEIDGG